MEELRTKSYLLGIGLESTMHAKVERIGWFMAVTLLWISLLVGGILQSNL